MLVSNEFEVSQPVDKVWEFFHDVPGWPPACPAPSSPTTSATTSTPAR